jgi:16S rRNA (adenine1518-N6/adenine1519-N6)-dimethyltransferase
LADRLTAASGSRDYGRITVILRYCADIRPLAKAGAHLFFPKPQVDSTVVEIEFKPVIENPADNEALLVRVIQAAFGQRRKTLKNALSAGLSPIPGPEIEQLLRQAGIDPIRRAETLSVAEFVRLSNMLSQHPLPAGPVPCP